MVRVLTLLHMDLDLDWTELQAGGNKYFKNCFLFASNFSKRLNIRISTEFVLLADDLDWGGGWINLERSIRLLTQVDVN